MSIKTEKAEVIRRFDQVHDIALIQAIKNLLDFGLSKQVNDDSALDASISRGLKQSKKGIVRAHNEVMADIRKRYRK